MLAAEVLRSATTYTVPTCQQLSFSEILAFIFARHATNYKLSKCQQLSLRKCKQLQCFEIPANLDLDLLAIIILQNVGNYDLPKC